MAQVEPVYTLNYKAPCPSFDKQQIALVEICLEQQRWFWQSVKDLVAAVREAQHG